ncbi:MAG: Stk1 family PASTA domain-containing Ser/Thr kinase [Propionibacteriaceae bacterium]|nr:Stk1 family PASTA domain-containing Ser/Thr kinase [Propionibacteriaceae bacterium]
MSDQPIMLGNRYRLDRIIGRGGMAEVWRAWDTRLGRDVAVKRLRADLATDPTFQARFQREAQSAAGLNHPNIVSVYDTGAERDANTGIDIPFIVMELVQGTTLRDLLRDGRQILPERSLEFTAGVLDALAYAHKHGIVHRDIKPGNVMLTTVGTIKVMDFGIARAVSDTSATMTQTAAVIGTAQYLSPEQARGETVDARSDLYSVGCLLYELLTSRPPFIGDSPVSVAYQHVREQPIPPSHIDSELTLQMDTIVMTALAKDPNDRYQSAQAMRDDVQRLLDGKVPVGAGAQPATPDSTRVLSDRPAPGARPRRGFNEMNAAAVVVGADHAGVHEDDTVSNLLPDGAIGEKAPPPKQRIPTLAIVLIGMIVVLLTVAGVVLYKVMQPPPENPTATVPDLKGMTDPQARLALQNVNLVIGTVDHVSGPDDATVGQVVNQDPPPQTVLDQGKSVSFTINDGPQMGVVPDNLYGMSDADARKALATAKFSNVSFISATQGTDEPKDFDAGKVLSVDPASGSRIPLGTQITVTLSTGKSTVPQLTGMSLDSAVQFATQNGGFELSVEQQVIAGCGAGTVCSQQPAAGSWELRKNKIFVIIGLAPPDVTPPASTQPVTPPTETPASTPSTPETGG